jgi:drug/metabolite transporter (DMT)-like permease
VYFAVFLCFLGVSLLTDLRNLGMPGRGDVLTFICAVCFAIDIILIALWARDHDPILFGLAQLGLAGLFHLILAIVMQSPFAIPSGALVQVLVLSLLCSGVTAVVSVWGQRHISESHCALIFSLEPMVGAGLGILILKEPFGWELALGGALVMAGILMARPDAKRSSPESMHDHIEAVNAMHAAGGGIHAAQAIEKAPS